MIWGCGAWFAAAMVTWNAVLLTLARLVPSLAVAVGAILVLFLVNFALKRREQRLPGQSHLFRQLLVISPAGVGVVSVILALPVHDAARAQLLGLLGLLLTAVIALSSTTLVGNALAGLMLRVIKGRQGGYGPRCPGPIVPRRVAESAAYPPFEAALPGPDLAFVLERTRSL